MRGEEILSGAQRVHDADFLAQQMRKFGVEPDSPGLEDYVESFRNGAPPR